MCLSNVKECHHVNRKVIIMSFPFEYSKSKAQSMILRIMFFSSPSPAQKKCWLEFLILVGFFCSWGNSSCPLPPSDTIFFPILNELFTFNHMNVMWYRKKKKDGSSIMLDRQTTLFLKMQRLWKCKDSGQGMKPMMCLSLRIKNR